MTYEELVDECKRLRAAAEAAEGEFFRFLMRVERDHESVWREAGCSTFEQFLRSNNLVKVDRYALFVKGTERIGETNAAKCVHSTIFIGRQPDPKPKQVAEYIKRVDAFREVHRTAPSEEAAREWSKEVFRRPAEAHKTIRRVDELHRLREENKTLRSQLAAAHARIAELEQGARKGKKAA